MRPKSSARVVAQTVATLCALALGASLARAGDAGLSTPDAYAVATAIGIFDPLGGQGASPASSTGNSAPDPIELAQSPAATATASSEVEEQKRQAEEWTGGATFQPLGYTGHPVVLRTGPDENFVPIPDRWRIGFPDWDRYTLDTPGEYQYQHGNWWNPYDQNMLKGDYPILGDHTFLNLTGVSDTIWEMRRLPTPSGVSTQVFGSPGFFGGGDQVFVLQNFVTSFDLFHGDAGFKPFDWEFKFTPVFDINYLDTQERGIVNINPQAGTSRTDGHVAIQEMFGEYKVMDLSPSYDVLTVTGGIQEFTSDFRGFIYSDSEPGGKIFANYEANRDQFNLAYFSQLEKDTDSGLNTIFDTRDQNVVVSNFTRQDFIFPGYNAQLDFDYNNDNGGSRKYDDNGFLVRPAYVGTIKEHTINAAYFGVTGDGHIGRINVTNAFYEVTGRDSYNQIAGRPVTINAQMGALELSYDQDWKTYKLIVLLCVGRPQCPQQSRYRLRLDPRQSRFRRRAVQLLLPSGHRPHRHGPDAEGSQQPDTRPAQLEDPGAGQLRQSRPDPLQRRPRRQNHPQAQGLVQFQLGQLRSRGRSRTASPSERAQQQPGAGHERGCYLPAAADRQYHSPVGVCGLQSAQGVQADTILRRNSIRPSPR